jgi:hypothetical protein
VAALAGRRIDAPDAGAPRFPLARREAVRAELLGVLRREGVGALVCSAACGADLLALDAAGALGVERHVVLPFARARFRETSVADRPGDWGPLFDRIAGEVAAARRLVELGLDEADARTYARANAAILDRAAALAASRGARAIAVAVWDGRRRGPADVTADFRDGARQRGWPLVDVATAAGG